MSSIAQAYAEATEAVLQEVLAPELAHRLAQQIGARVRPVMQEMLQTWVGCDLAPRALTRPKATGRGKAKVAPVASPASAAATDGSGDKASAAHQRRPLAEVQQSAY